jgi:putative transposase
MIKSERWTSKYLNKDKLNLLKQVNEDTLSLKNEMSKFIFNHIKELYYDQDVYSFSKKYLNKFKSEYLKTWNVQTLFQDTIKFYLNIIKVNTQNKDLKITKSFKTTYYLKNTKYHNKGDVKEIRIIKQSTNLTKFIKYLSYCDLNNLKLKPEIELLYNYYCDKFTKERIHNLVRLIQKNILKNIKQIEFTTGTFRATYTTNKINRCSQFINDDTNSLYKYWFKLDLRNHNVYLPLQFNKDYNDFDKIRNAQYFIKVVNNKVNIISTKDVQDPTFKEFKECLGVDLNVKHNFCCLSNNKEFDYDRKYIKEFIKELKKLDKIGLKNINVNQRKHLNKLIKRNEWYFKYLISNILDYCELNNITDLVMEDLDSFNATFTKNDEFDIKYSRLCRLLRLSNIKNWFKEQAEKRSIKVHLTPANYSSQQCSKCGCIHKLNRQNQETFKCIECEFTLNADLNASINLKQRLMNVSLNNSKLHSKDSFNRLLANTKNKYLIKNILQKNFSG